MNAAYQVVQRTGKYFAVMSMFCLLLPYSRVSGQEDHHQKVDENAIHLFPKLTVTLSDFQADGLVLDIGGGGEGVIGQLKGNQVVAIDINRRELEDAPDGPLKIVMDATELGFLNDAFQTVTCFYTLMYIPENLHTAVLEEVFRVMQPGGVFRVWDVAYPPRTDPNKEIGAVLLNIKLPDREINTGYGGKWPVNGRPLSYYQELAKAAGFQISVSRENQHTFHLQLKKPDA
jgi:SAM-dependent methyltransferase